ncbi:MAG: TonB-dependent receptor, partial [Anaerolineales bacterium]|nr:TonB-dependent receptor [Anaerolineales bacterium]
YPRHSLTGFSSFSLPLGLSYSQRIDYKKRHDGRDYWLVDARLMRNFDETTVFVEVTNLLNTDYQELLGVDMPGRWFRAGFNWKFF